MRPDSPLGVVYFQDVLDRLTDALFRERAHGHLGLLFQGNKEHRWNALNPKNLGQLLFCIGIDFVDVDTAGVFIGDLLQNRGDHFTGATPVGVKIYDCRPFSEKFPVLVLFEIKNFLTKGIFC
ncbi:hypothetical protein SAMN05920897_11114 [Alkalispirochaeta americana]|uniref:Uncharacterized protein n=1 Tax=Alkalispirochaeta americana TaxID=159291 RepID=A0A1N6TVT2_9SPIO|nr:hypothetical protein SAMN05920897_11114 [Alkalispirochaeta americana]